ncbi:hypothetical protein SAMN05421545_0814 [Pontibacter lucknowensis]|uniref:Uncharacterized protein n=1 Tax=Pontibacter lucknowensis TaxID=1077936 RepID=A0A1N6UD88_9BACT|nr:hypothetical protein SAMN05421545_0814 [Pontibacter lucknowensis]
MKKFTLNESKANLIVAAYFVLGGAISSLLVVVA